MHKSKKSIKSKNDKVAFYRSRILSQLSNTEQQVEENIKQIDRQINANKNKMLSNEKKIITKQKEITGLSGLVKTQKEKQLKTKSNL